MKFLFLITASLSFATVAAFAQGNGTYGNLAVTGTATIKTLNVTGLPDFEGNSAYLGTLSGPSEAAVGFLYSDGTSGTGSSFTTLLARPGAVWNWERSNQSPSAMELDANNRLILSGTQSGAASIVIDPAGGNITVHGQQVVGGSAFNFSASGDIGIDTSTPTAKFDIEGPGNVILGNGEVGIGADPTTQITNSFPAASLFIAEPAIASIRLMTTEANHSLTTSAEAIDFADGPGNEFIGETSGLNADYPGAGLYQPRQLNFWSGQAGGILILARDWPGAAGPIVLADGDYSTGEVMRITTNHMVGIGGEKAPASLVSIKGNASVGIGYSEVAAPPNALIVQSRIGIGTATPQVPLDVSGEARIAGFLVVTGTGHAVLINPAGDLSMGTFTAGTLP